MSDNRFADMHAEAFSAVDASWRLCLQKKLFSFERSHCSILMKSSLVCAHWTRVAKTLYVK